MMRSAMVLAAFAVAADAFGGPAVFPTTSRQHSPLVLHSIRPRRFSTLRMNADATTISTEQSGTQKSKPILNKISFSYNFLNVPFQKGMEHIHSPEHISSTHKMGAPFFKLLKVLPPKLSESKASITYFCSTLLLKSMYIRMYTSQPNVSNLLFFNKGGKALYGVTLTVLPLNGFASHKLVIDINLFTRWLPKAVISAMMPMFLFINGLEDTIAFMRENPMEEDKFFSEYRKMVSTNFNKKIAELNSEIFEKFSL